MLSNIGYKFATYCFSFRALKLTGVQCSICPKNSGGVAGWERRRRESGGAAGAERGEAD